MTYTEDEIIKYLNRLEEESKAIKRELLKICWYMRGGLSYDDSMLLSFAERDIIAKIVDDNMEVTRKTGMPFY